MLRALSRLFDPRDRSRSPRRRARLALEVLEARSVPTVGFDWAVTASPPTGATLSWERAYDIAIDGSGNSYVAGTFAGSSDFDTTDTDSTTNPGLVLTSTPLGSGYYQSGFIAKYNASGQCLWATALTPAIGGSALSSEGSAIAFDAANGRVVVTGWRTANPSGTTVKDGYVAWFSADTGAAQSVQIFGGTRNEDYGADVAVDSTGNAYVAGAIENAPGSIFVNRDIYVARFNADTSKAWERTNIGGNTYADFATSVAVDSGGNVMVGGSFAQTVDFDPGPGTYSLFAGGSKTSLQHAGFVLKLNTAGNFVWADHFALSTSSGSGVEHLVVDKTSGNITVQGNFHGNVDFNPDKKASYNVRDTGQYVVQLDSAGKFRWVNTMSNMTASGLGIGSDGSIYVTYQVTGSSSNPSYFTQLNSTNGSVVQTITMARPALGIAVDDSNNVYLAGYFDGTDVDFDFTSGTRLLSGENGQTGMFVMKLHL